MADRHVLTTWEAGRYCSVSPYTVRHWIRTGRLKAYTTPGGHRRIRRRDLDAFLLGHGMPLPEDARKGKRRILVVAGDAPGLVSEIEGWSQEIEVRAVRSPFEAGLALAAFEPNLLLLDLDWAAWDGLAACRQVNASPKFAGVKLAAMTRRGDVETLQAAEEAGALVTLSKPVDRAELLALLKKFFPTCAWTALARP